MSAELVGSLRAAAAAASAAESDASAALPASPAASASPEAASEARAVPLSADLLEDWLSYFGFPREGVASRGFFVSSRGTRLFILSLEPPEPRARALLVHGYMAHSGHLADLAARLLSRGFAVELLDLPGHGLSGGEPVYIADFRDYGAAVGAALEAVPTGGLKRFGIGHSTGAAALWERVRSCGETDPSGGFSGLVFAGPLFRLPSQGFYEFANELAGERSVPIPRIPYAPRGVIRNPAYLEFSRGGDPFRSTRYDPRWLEALEAWVADNGAPAPLAGRPPLLIAQGDIDEVVDWRRNLDWYATAFPETRIRVFPGLSHTILNELPADREEVFAAILDFLEELLARG